jgi:hypothetical protein
MDVYWSLTRRVLKTGRTTDVSISLTDNLHANLNAIFG